MVAATGRASSPTKLCDSAARFETAGAGRHRPTWVQRTGGDSLYAVAVTGAAVYVGGHQRYLDNPYGSDAKGPGPGAVSRLGIGAVSPTTGRALAWNPTRARGVGVRAFLVTPRGLLVGSDTDQLGHEYHGRIGMFPLSIPESAAPRWIRGTTPQPRGLRVGGRSSSRDTPAWNDRADGRH